MYRTESCCFINTESIHPIRNVIKKYRDRFYLSKNYKSTILSPSKYEYTSSALPHTLPLGFYRRILFYHFHPLKLSLFSSRFLSSEIKKTRGHVWRLWRMLKLSDVVLGQKPLNRKCHVSRCFFAQLWGLVLEQIWLRHVSYPKSFSQGWLNWSKTKIEIIC